MHAVISELKSKERVHMSSRWKAIQLQRDLPQAYVALLTESLANIILIFIVFIIDQHIIAELEKKKKRGRAEKRGEKNKRKEGKALEPEANRNLEGVLLFHLCTDIAENNNT